MGASQPQPVILARDDRRVSSKSARLRRRRAVRLREIKRLRKAGRLPVHTRTERKRQELKCRAEHDAALRRIQRVRQGAAVAAVGVGAGVMLGVMTTPAAAASTPPAAAHNDYRAYRALRDEIARQRESGVPVLQPLSSSYGHAWRPGRDDEMPHNEFPEPILYAGDAPYMGTAPSAGALARLRPSGLPAWDVERYEVSARPRSLAEPDGHGVSDALRLAVGELLGIRPGPSPADEWYLRLSADPEPVLSELRLVADQLGDAGAVLAEARRYQIMPGLEDVTCHLCGATYGTLVYNLPKAGFCDRLVCDDDAGCDARAERLGRAERGE